jgi:glycosyltransferase involved in cell wall biosynthesis
LKQIFHIITTINRGGAENQLLILVSEQVLLGYEVSVVYLKGEPELRQALEDIGAVVVDSVSSMPAPMQPLAISKLISGKDVIVHAHLPRAELVSFLVPSKFTLVTSRHNVEPFFPGAPKWLSNFLASLVALRARRIIAISHSVSEYLFRLGEVRDASKVRVIYYGYQVRNINRLKANNGSYGDTNLGTISRLAEQKDLPTMFNVLEKYKVHVPDATLRLVGAGPLESTLRDLAKRMSLEKTIFFEGRRSDVLDYLKSLDVFLLTSKYEGFGMVLLEAMDAGVPIIASRNSAITEVMGENFLGLCETGNPSDFSEKILRLQDPQYRSKVLQSQEDRLALFNSLTMAKKIIETYNE